MSRAEEYGCERDHSELAESQLSVVISAEQVTFHPSFMFIFTRNIFFFSRHVLGQFLIISF